MKSFKNSLDYQEYCQSRTKICSPDYQTMQNAANAKCKISVSELRSVTQVTTTLTISSTNQFGQFLNIYHFWSYQCGTAVSSRNEKQNCFNVKTILTLFTKTTPHIILFSGTQGLNYVQIALGIHKFVKIPLRWLTKWTITFQL